MTPVLRCEGATVRFGAFTALHGIETDRLQWLQGRAQHMPLRPLYTTRNQADTAVFGAQHLDQQAGFTPGPRMQHECGLGDETHAQSW